MSAVVVLVPAYEPDERLVALVTRLRAARADLPVVVVDDGSGPRYAGVFAAVAEAGATVLRHDENRGKGRALKTGFAYVADQHPGAGVVCADCDGQHTVDDVLVVADRVMAGDADLVLGVRLFTGDVPWRSRFGNACTRTAFHLGSGRRLQDTQTGLRAYPAHLLTWLGAVRGERFEYELAVLLRAVAEGRCVVEVPIATVYLEANASSHFRPVVDSVRVYAPLLRFTASSLVAFAVDTAVLVALVALLDVTDALLVAVVAARVVSSGVNFATNRWWVFRRHDRAPAGREAVRYWTLAVLLLAAGYGGLWALTVLGVPLLAAKIATDLTLFLVGFQVQRTRVFVRAPAPPDAAGWSGGRVRVRGAAAPLGRPHR